MNPHDRPKSHVAERLCWFAVACLVGYHEMANHFQPVAKRCEDCAAAISAYRRLCESHGVVDDRVYHRQVGTIFLTHGFQGDAEREYRKADELTRTKCGP